MQRPRHVRFTKKSLIIGTILALMVAGGGVLAFQQTRPDNPRQVSEEPQTTSESNDDINLDPPTDEEKKETEQHKDDLAKQNEQPNPGGNTPVTLTIIDATQYDQVVEVRVMVAGVYEEGGVCKATLTKAGQTVTKQSSSFKDATTTSCMPLIIPRSEFPSAGDWSLTVSYTSSAASGTSPAKTVRIQ